jgi:hypothetical protein
MSSHTLRVGLCGGEGVPTGASGGPPLIAYQNSWSWDGTNYKFTGSLNLNTSEMATFLGALDRRTSTLEIEATPSGGSPIKYLQERVSVKAEVIEVGSSTPTPVEEYYTKTEIDAMGISSPVTGSFTINDPNDETTIAVSGMTTSGIAFARLDNPSAAAGGTITHVISLSGSIKIKMGSNPGVGNSWTGKYIVFTKS